MDVQWFKVAHDERKGERVRERQRGRRGEKWHRTAAQNSVLSR